MTVLGGILGRESSSIPHERENKLCAIGMIQKSGGVVNDPDHQIEDIGIDLQLEVSVP